TAAGATTTVNAGGGNDGVAVGPLLDSVRGALTVNGQGGTNAMTVTDLQAIAAQTYNFTPTTVSRAGMATITFSNEGALTLEGNDRGNPVNIAGIAAGVAFTANTGGGSDTINLGDAAHTLNGFAGTLHVNGQGATDTLNVNDQGTATPLAYTL